MLPPKINSKPKRESRWKSPAHCNFIRQHQCSVNGCTEMPIEVAHVRIGSGAGMGQKPDDFNAISLCSAHHQQQHSVGEVTFQQRHRIDMMGLAEAFAKASPKAKEIAEVKRQRKNGTDSLA